MPIIQGAVAAGSGAARASGLSHLSAEQRREDIGRIREIRDRFWSSYPKREHMEVGGETGIVATTQPGSPMPDDEEEVATPCWFGLIADERKARAAVMDFFEEPASSSGAYVTMIIVFLCIVISTITIILESLPALSNEDAEKDFYIVEIVCVAVFTVEYVVRFIAVGGMKERCAFVISPMNVIDLVAILPFYFGLLFGDGLELLRLLRLFRIFRIFKLSKYSSGIKICATAIIESKDTLGLMIFMCSIVVIIFGSFEFFWEGGSWNQERRRFEYDDGKATQYFSIPASMWWTIVTVMTVGYGDMVPTTEMGKLTAAVAMVCSIVIMALPISVIGANFSRAWMEKKEQEESVSDGRQLAYCFQNLLTSLIKHNSLMEEVLSAGSHSLHTLHSDLRKAQSEYAKLKPDAAERDWSEAHDMTSENSQRLKVLVDSIMEQDRELQFCLKKVITVQQSDLEEKARATLVQGKDLENYILRYQEISANIIGLEQVMFGHSLSVSGR